MILTDLEPWRAHAACIGTDPRYFFPANGENPDTVDPVADRLCEGCPVDLDYWAERDGAPGQLVVIGGHEEGPDVIPCPAIITTEANLVHVALRLDEIEVARLAQGGTLWLTTWGGLPIHLVEVV